MTTTGVVVVAAYVLALAAAVRSTWSPCGLSMLSTITPMGERGRGQRYRVTAAWYILGAVLGGTMLGAALMPVALACRDLSAVTAVGLASLAAALGAAGDLGLLGYRLPVLRRQVNERWLDQYRTWVYGAGFGWQIGVGLSTYVMTTAVPATLCVAALTGSPWRAAPVGLVFGLTRGLAVLLTSGVDGLDGLQQLHRRIEALRRPVRAAVVAVQIGVALTLLAVAWPPSLVVAVPATAAAAGLLTLTRLRRLVGQA